MSWRIPRDPEAGANTMCEILQLTPRKARPCSHPAPSPADIIIFPGVRIERCDLGRSGRADGAPGGPNASLDRRAWTDE
jgi:hypothetical protein